jgi:hypothetical protein
MHYSVEVPVGFSGAATPIDGLKEYTFDPKQINFNHVTTPLSEQNFRAIPITCDHIAVACEPTWLKAAKSVVILGPQFPSGSGFFIANGHHWNHISGQDGCDEDNSNIPHYCVTAIWWHPLFVILLLIYLQSVNCVFLIIRPSISKPGTLVCPA